MYLMACLQLDRLPFFENRTRFFHNAWHRHCFWATRKYRFALCFRALSNQCVQRRAYANIFKFNRENEPFGRGKLNARCLHRFPAAMLEPLRRAPTWRLHTKHYNFQWYLLPNNSCSEYRTSPKPWHIVYSLLLYNISIFWLNLLNGKWFYFSLAW